MVWLRRTKVTGGWTLLYTDRRLCFQRYDAGPATAQVGDMLAEIDSDPIGIVWG